MMITRHSSFPDPAVTMGHDPLPEIPLPGDPPREAPPIKEPPAPPHPEEMPPRKDPPKRKPPMEDPPQKDDPTRIKIRPGAVMKFLFIVMVVMVLGGTATAAQILNDKTIVTAVEDELLFDQAVPSYHMRVTCTDGIITLTGTVESLLAKNRAVDIAETVKGVRSVINKIQVSPMADYTDEQIRGNVFRALVENPATDLKEILVEVSSGTVTLAGRVDSYMEKDLARIVASGVSGVTRVINEIVFSIDRNRPDSEIAADIRQGLRWDALVDNERISVQVKNGTVSLTGVVGSAAEKQRAIGKAWLPGIRGVNADGLSVEGWARDPALREHKYKAVSDDGIRRAVVRAVELEEKINRALERDAYLDTYEISATVRHGVACLSGTVQTAFEKARAGDVASVVPGVFAVDNTIRSRRVWRPFVYNPYVDDSVFLETYGRNTSGAAEPVKSDWEIRSSIKNELWWSPFVDADQVKVTVDDGRATLEGEVDSRLEFNAAVENAFEGGAVSVDNDLTISGLAGSGSG